MFWEGVCSESSLPSLFYDGYAPIAQWIEHLPSKQGITVRFCMGVLFSYTKSKFVF